ncbi:MAG: ankyrin repeat domain-containing protein [Candidatus Sericytochromatia bacterium]
MRKVLLGVILSLSLLSVGEVLVNPSEAKVINKKVSKEELNKKLIEAIENNDIKLVKNLILKGADINFVFINEYNNSFTPLILSILYGNKEISNLLIEKVIDPNIKDNYSRPALFFALEKGYVGIAEKLIKKGANVNIRFKHSDYENFTPLMWTSFYLNKIDLAKLILSKGGDIDAKTNEGFTPLIIASEFNNISMVKFLLERKANINASINEGYYIGYTSLMFAIQNENEDLVKLLISKGANVNSIISDGKYKGYTLLSFASNIANKSIIDILKKYGAK